MTETLPVDGSIANTPANIEALPQLLKEISHGITHLTSHGQVDRHQLLAKCRAMTMAIQTPRETMVDHCIMLTSSIAAIGFGIETGLWKLMANNGDRAQRVDDLAASLGVDRILLSRMMRHMGATGYITETGAEEYQPTPFSKSLSLPRISSGYGYIVATAQSIFNFGNFCRERAWKLPTSENDTCFQQTNKTDQGFLAWVHDNGYGPGFNEFLGGFYMGRIPWMASGYYPVKERLIQGADTRPDAAFLVDIGGNVGHNLADFKQHYPEVPGSLILQDLPVVIGQIEHLDPSIVRMPYDFHTQQPVKGARAYFMRAIMHDWSDQVCLSILARVKVAMKPGYSRLLINEFVIPPTGAYWEATALDLQLLTLMSSSERTQAQWVDLLEKRAGLKIIGIWNSGRMDSENLIECELVP
ncbi:hypothetical protein CDD82_4882 [Ophiocordyceps australis]|uniref:O-methyltransferase C-terminal domain-containing protein n=1 Tax=Ophiocordyceps australis TaxID=1399860 RepID=A0A2C5Z425_9HYPO|nr:hypothetical protein CDD82_4882 [Ophiocordyceps australis]